MFKTILTALFLAIALTLQITGLPKLLTGVIVNVIYVVLYYSCGFRHVFMMAVLTPLLAFFTGHLAPPLIPLAPFIAFGNIAMVCCYHLVKDKKMAVRITAPAIVKALSIAIPGSLLAGSAGFNQAALMGVHIVISLQFFTAAPGILLGEYIVSRLTPLLKRYTDQPKGDFLCFRR